jgi:hypothetical protein
VNPRSHIRTNTSVKRHPSSPVLGCNEALRFVRALAFHELMIEWSVIAETRDARREPGTLREMGEVLHSTIVVLKLEASGHRAQSQCANMSPL